MPGKDGVSLRKHLQQVERQIKRRPPELVEPAVPAAGNHIWGWFWSLDGARPMGLSVTPISFSEIAAWRNLMGEIVRPWEVSALRAMDAARMAATDEAKN